MSTAYNVTAAWAAGTRYTAAADVDVLITTTGPYGGVFEITPDDTAPAITPAQGHRVPPGPGQPLQLKTGDRIWLAAEAAATSITLGVLTV